MKKDKDGKISVRFTTTHLNTGKINTIIAVDDNVMKSKNDYSMYFYNNVDDSLVNLYKRNMLGGTGTAQYQTLGNENRHLFDSGLFIMEHRKIVERVLSNYLIKTDTIIANLSKRNKLFKMKTIVEYEYYKKNSPANSKFKYKKGDIKHVRYINVPTAYSDIMQTIMWFDSYEDIINITKGIISSNGKIIKVVSNSKGVTLDINSTWKNKILKAIDFLDKHTEIEKNIIFRVAKAERIKLFDLIHEKYSPIVYNDGTHTICDNRTEKAIIEKINSKTGKKTYYFKLMLSNGFKKRGSTIVLPLFIDDEYIKDKDLFNENNTAREFTIKVDRNTSRVHFSYAIDAVKPDYVTMYNVIGADVNMKTNMMYCSDGFVLHYNWEKIVNFIKRWRRIEKAGYKKATTSKRQTREIENLIGQAVAYFNYEISRFIKHCISCGITDIVMEDLNLSCNFIPNVPIEVIQELTRSEKEATELKEYIDTCRFKKLASILRLNSFKLWVQSQAKKKNIRVHFTPSAYTSKMCSECGHIDDANRTTQESFECVKCGHKENADFNAAKNIRNRYLNEKLRKSKLHKINNDGIMVASGYNNREIIKGFLEDAYKEAA